MNIAFLFAYHKSENWSTPISLVNAFTHLGHKGTIYSLQNDQRQYTADALMHLTQQIARKDVKFDMIIHMDCGDYNHILLDKKYFGPSFYVLEAGDDPQAFYKNQHKAPNAHLVLSPDRNCVQTYKDRGINAIWWTHFADVFVGQETIPIHDAEYAVVSTRGDGDTPFLDELKKKTIHSFLNKRDYSVLQHEILSQGRIVIQNSRNKELTRRVFEGMMCKRLVLTDAIDESTGLYELFTPNEDIVVYHSMDEAVELIENYAIDINETKRIAENGYNKVCMYHSNICRAQTIIAEYSKWVKR